MDSKTEERIHERIDATHKLINDVNIDYAEQKQIMLNLGTLLKEHIKKIDDCIFHPEEGHIAKAKTNMSAICTQLKNQWYLITLLFGGVMGVMWMVIANFPKK